MVEAKKDVKSPAKSAAAKTEEKVQASKTEEKDKAVKSEAGQGFVREEVKPVSVKAQVKPAPVKAESKPAPVKAESKPAPVKAESKPAQDKPETLKEEGVASKKAKPAREGKVPSKRTAALSAKKETVKKETVKKGGKNPVRRSSSKKQAAVKTEVHFQFGGKDLTAEDVLNQAMKAFRRIHRGVEIKTIELYIVACEGTAYYVVNGEAKDDFKLML